MTSRTGELYQAHHQQSRQPGFSILKDERGRFLAGKVGTGKRVLDIGCRDGALTESFVKGNSVLGVDIDSEALSRAAELGIETRLVDLMGDLHEIENETFDVIVAGEVLEHLFFPEKIVEKVVERLNPGGIFIGSVPNAFSLKNRARYLMGTKKYTPLSDPTHINQFSAEELELLLKKYLVDVEIGGLGRYVELSRMSPNWFAFDLVFVGKKP